MAKRRKAIADNSVRHQFVIQAYVSNQRFLSAAIIEADVLYRDIIDAHRDEINRDRRLNNQGRGNATFVPVWWSMIEAWGYRIKIIESK